MLAVAHSDVGSMENDGHDDHGARCEASVGQCDFGAGGCVNSVGVCYVDHVGGMTGYATRPGPTVLI